MAADALHLVRARFNSQAARPVPHPLAGGVLVASVGEPPSLRLVRVAAGWMMAAQSRRMLLLHVREVPGVLPLGAWPLDPAAMAELRGWVAGFRRQGLRAEFEVADCRSAARAVIDRALAMRARAVVLGSSRTARGNLREPARTVMRRLRNIEIVLYTG